MGFFAKGDGRIATRMPVGRQGIVDSSGDRAPWQVRRKGMKPKAVHFPLRPDPLANDNLVK